LIRGLDPGIRRAVEILRSEGFATFESCEGGKGHSYAEPTVRFEGDDREGWAALAVLTVAGLPVDRVPLTWDVRDVEYRWGFGQRTPTPFWEVTLLRKLG